ncbi:MAG: hypothetical protein P4L34_14105 [Paludibacter sp.]|nr:hypothetical protein [Paludibacter sp.]
MKKTNQIIVNLFLFLGLFLLILLAFNAFKIGEMRNFASYSAMIIAIGITFISVQIIWKIEVKNAPNIVTSLKSDERGNEIQLIVKNIGGGNAYDIKFNWIDALSGINANEIKLPNVPVLHNGDCVKVLLGKSTKLFRSENNESDLFINGEIQFKYSKTNKYFEKKQFKLKIEPVRAKERPIDEQEFRLPNHRINKNAKGINNRMKVLVD